MLTKHLECPNCGSSRVRRSHARGIERTFGLFLVPYRCGPCDSRFFGRPRGAEHFGGTKPQERRRAYRVDAEESVVYRVLNGPKGVSGRGRTVNISASGFLFEPEHSLPVGSSLEVTILSAHHRAPNLAKARVVRSENGRVAVQIAPLTPMAGRLLPQALLQAA